MIASFSSGMPSTAVYLVLPASMAWIAASLMLAGRVEIGLAGAEADDVAARRFQRACFIRDRDGRGRLHTVERSGQKRHHHLLADVVNTCATIHDSYCWDRRTLKRATLHRKKLAPKQPNFRER